MSAGELIAITIRHRTSCCPWRASRTNIFMQPAPGLLCANYIQWVPAPEARIMPIAEPAASMTRSAVECTACWAVVPAFLNNFILAVLLSISSRVSIRQPAPGVYCQYWATTL